MARLLLLNRSEMAQFTRAKLSGGVVEWLMAPVLKTGRAQALVGSNPTPSADLSFDFRLRGRTFSTARYVHVNLWRGEAEKQVCSNHRGRSPALPVNPRPRRLVESGQ